MKSFTKKFLASALAAMGILTASGLALAADDLPFTDVPANAWYRPFVAYTYEQSLFAGTSATTFSPGRDITRGEMVTVVGKMHAQLTGENPADAGITSTFSDVADNQYYAAYVGWAQANGIAAGYSDGNFHPDDTITREMAATIMNNYVERFDIELEGTRQIDGDYQDADSISAWAQAAVENITAHGVMSGSDTGNFMPQNSTTRAETAAILTNLYQDIKYPTETDVSYQSIRYTCETADAFQVLDEPYTVISDYDAYLSIAEKALTCADDADAFAPLAESYFETGNVIAVELQNDGAPLYQTKLSSYTETLTTGSVSADIALTFFSTTGSAGGDLNATADTVGYVFLIEVPRYDGYSVTTDEIWKVGA